MQREIAEKIGEREIIETKEAISYGANPIRDGVSINSHQRMEKLVLPTQIGNLAKFEFYMCLSGLAERALLKISLAKL